MAKQVGPVLSKPELSTGLRGRKRNQERERTIHHGQEKYLHQKAVYIDASFYELSGYESSLQHRAGPYINRDCASRNALSGVKVSSPDKQISSVMAMRVLRSEAIPTDLWSVGVTGVQVHGEYRRRLLELGRSLEGRPTKVEFDGQGFNAKFKIIPTREVRWAHSSGEVG